jgi:hypothetical protein
MFRKLQGIFDKRGSRKSKAQQANSGQSTVEYIVLVTAVIATVIFFVAPGQNGQGKLQNKIVTVMNDTAEGFVTQSGVLDSSHNGTITVINSQIPVDAVSNTSLFDR